MKKITPLKIIGSFFALMIIIPITVFLFSESDHHKNFAYAADGEYWIINQSGVPLLSSPEMPSNSADLNRKALGFIPSGSIVEITDTGGFASPWKRVYVLDQDRNPGADGWINYKWVEKSSNLGKSFPN